jgi:hypothetical protein
MRERDRSDGTEPGPRTAAGGFALGRPGEPIGAGPELARLAADGGPVEEIVARLRPAGLSALDGLRVVVLAAHGGVRPLDILRALIDEPCAAVARLSDGRVLAVLNDPPPRAEPAVDARLAARLALLAPSFQAERVAVGVSDLITTATALSAAVCEAGHALALATARAEPTAVAGPDDLATHRALLAHVPDELRGVYVRRLLGPLRAHDARHRTVLEQTLDVFLQCSGSWTRSADRLHIHVNTLRYRIARIAELTGRDPTELAGQTDLLLALSFAPRRSEDRMEDGVAGRVGNRAAAPR